MLKPTHESWNTSVYNMHSNTMNVNAVTTIQKQKQYCPKKKWKKHIEKQNS